MSSLEVFSRKLNFKYSNLPAGRTLLLCFQNPSEEKLSSQQSYVAWKVLYLKAGQIGNEPVSFEAKLAFAQAEVDRGNMVTGNVIVPVNQSDVVTLSPDPSGHGNAWSKPVRRDAIGNLIKARNQTAHAVDISVGFISGRDDYNATFLFRDVGANQTVEAEYHPILSAWVTSDYQEGEFLSADIVNDTPVWTMNLADLPNQTTWRFIQKHNGDYMIEKA